MMNPVVYARAKAEVRETFSTAEEITLQKLATLPYLNACFEEGLRIFPPAPDSLPRLVPEGGDVICGKFVPEGVSSNTRFFSFLVPFISLTSVYRRRLGSPLGQLVILKVISKIQRPLPLNAGSVIRYMPPISSRLITPSHMVREIVLGRTWHTQSLGC